MKTLDDLVDEHYEAVQDEIVVNHLLNELATIIRVDGGVYSSIVHNMMEVIKYFSPMSKEEIRSVLENIIDENSL